MAAKPQYWNELLEHQFQTLSSDCLNGFKALKTNFQRIEFIFTNEKLRTCLETWLADFVSCNYKKSDEESEKFRVEGNFHFKENEDQLAIQKYTQSILQAQSEKTLSLAFANRSAAFFQLHLYKECLTDIERALTKGYPKALCYKLFIRKGKSHISLGQKDEAATSLNSALQYLEYSAISFKKKDTLRRQIKNLQEDCAHLPSTDNTDQSESVVLPPLLKGESQKIAWVSSALALKVDAFRGRHLMTRIPITSGDTLIVEKAFASVLLPDHYDTHCHHCHGKLLTSVGCKRCTQVQYCSEDCAEESWLKYHYIECSHLDILHSIGIAHLGLRVLLVAGIVTIIEMKDDLDSVKSPLGIPGSDEKNYYSASYYTVYHLMTHEEKINVEDLFAYALTASLLFMLIHHSLLKIVKLCSPPLEEEFQQISLNKHNAQVSPAVTLRYLESHKYFVGSILMHHIEQLICNAHAITSILGGQNNNNGTLETQEQVRIATAIFPSASLMNHSCNPTIISSFYKNYVIVKSANDVPVGVEIFNCYGPHFKRMRRNARQTALQQQYYFQCECEVCEMEGDTVDTYFAFRCVHCEGPVLPIIKKNDSIMLCSECRQSHDYKDEIKTMGMSELLFEMGEKFLENQESEVALQKFLKCFKLRKKILHEFNKDLALTQDRIAQCYAYQEKFEDALRHLRESIDVAAQIYGEDSLEYGHELQKLTDIILKVILGMEMKVNADNCELKEAIREAEEFSMKGVSLFIKHYGLWHEATQDFIDKQKHLTEIQNILRHSK